MKLNRWMGLAALTASVQFLSAADITGKITLKGTPPPAPEAPLDKVCGELLKSDKIKSGTYVVGGGGELADVVVFLKGAKGTAKTEPFLLDQKNCMYTPYVAAVQAGQTVNVRNSDTFMHNVHILPGADSSNKQDNKAQFPKGPDLKYTFTPEPFLTFKCDIHPWMYSYLYVVDSPYFAVSQKDGTYKISGVPAGKYTVVAQHRRAGTSEQEVTVADSGAKQDFTLEVPAKK